MEIDKTIVFLASPLSSAINGAVLRADGGVVKSAFEGSEKPPSYAARPSAPQAIVLGADVDPAAAATAVVAAIEPFGAKPGALAAIMGMPDCKNRAWLSRLKREQARLRFRRRRS
jgi:hypothetical protein